MVPKRQLCRFGVAMVMVRCVDARGVGSIEAWLCVNLVTVQWGAGLFCEGDYVAARSRER